MPYGDAGNGLLMRLHGALTVARSNGQRQTPAQPAGLPAISLRIDGFNLRFLTGQEVAEIERVKALGSALKEHGAISAIDRILVGFGRLFLVNDLGGYF